jgi:hypothetical protein
MATQAYPGRSPFYAMKFVRVLTKNCVATEHGTQVFTLLAVIVATEDSAKYQRAVTFWDGQLMPLVGANSQDVLARVRQRAVAAGWLSYQPGRKGVPGEYFVMIPPSAKGYSDAPVDESPEEMSALSSADSSADSSANLRENRRRIAGESPENQRTILPVPIPIPVEDSLEPKPAHKPTADDSQKSKPKTPVENPESTEPPVMVFPVVGSPDSPEWPLSASQVAEWSAAYPGVDVAAECRKAAAWVRANPSKRKTARGMPRFLVSWIGHSVDKGTAAKLPPAPAASPHLPPGTLFPPMAAPPTAPRMPR